MVSQSTPAVTEDTIQYNTSDEPEYDTYRDHAVSLIEDADVLVLTDGDADGIASAALIQSVFSNLSVRMIPVGPHGSAYKYTNTALEDIVEHGRDNLTVYILDTCLDDPDKFGFYETPLKNLGDKCSVYFFDHHDWSHETPKEVVSEISEHAEFEAPSKAWVYDGSVIPARSTVKMVYDYLVENGASFSPTVRERVFAVSIADTWEKENGCFIHEHSADLADSVQEITHHISLSDRYNYAWWGYREWVNEFLTHKNALECDSHITSLASTYQNRVANEVEFIKSNEDYLYTTAINNTKVGLVYGNVSPNEISEHFIQNEEFELVVTLRPNGGCSFRSGDSVPMCASLASEFDGGGHEHAAGGHLFNLPSFDQDEYIESKGTSIQEAVISKLRTAL